MKQATSALLHRSIRPSLALAAALAVCTCGPAEPVEPPPDGDSATRIVSLVPAFTETLLELGAAHRIVGIGRFDPEIPGRPDVPRLGDAFSVNLEIVVALEPDVALVNSKLLETALGPVSDRVPVRRIPYDSLDEVRKGIRTLAGLCDNAAGGDRIVARIDDALRSARERAERRRAAGTPAPRVLVVVQHRPWYAAGAGSYVHELLDLLGAENVLADVEEAWPSIGEESMVARAPDLILDTTVGTGGIAGEREVLRDWERYPTIPAVRDGRVRVVADDSLFRPGPRIPNAILLLERLLFEDPEAEDR